MDDLNQMNETNQSNEDRIAQLNQQLAELQAAGADEVSMQNTRDALAQAEAETDKGAPVELDPEQHDIHGNPSDSFVPEQPGELEPEEGPEDAPVDDEAGAEDPVQDAQEVEPAPGTEDDDARQTDELKGGTDDTVVEQPAPEPATEEVKEPEQTTSRRRR